MRGKPEPTEARDVLDHFTRITGQRIGRFWQIDGHIVAMLGADFDSVDTQHPRAIRRRLRRARPVPVIGDDDELKVGTRCRGRDLVNRSGAVGS